MNVFIETYFGFKHSFYVSGCRGRWRETGGEGMVAWRCRGRLRRPPRPLPAKVPPPGRMPPVLRARSSPSQPFPLQGWCALILIAFLIFFRLIALLALKRLNFQQR